MTRQLITQTFFSLILYKYIAVHGNLTQAVRWLWSQMSTIRIYFLGLSFSLQSLWFSVVRPVTCLLQGSCLVLSTSNVASKILPCSPPVCGDVMGSDFRHSQGNVQGPLNFHGVDGYGIKIILITDYMSADSWLVLEIEMGHLSRPMVHGHYAWD